MATKVLLALTKQCEGCKLVSYADPASGGEPWTIGYGQTGPDVGPNTVWTQAQADSSLESTLDKVQSGVKSLIKVKITQNQLDALTDFAYNVGLGNLEKSLLLRACNMNQWGSAAAQFACWNKASGKVMPGLTRRRALERELFEGGL